METTKLKILLLDIETYPIEAFIWGLWQETTSTKMIKRDWSIACWAAKWLGEKGVMSGWANGFDDRACLIALHKLMNEADIIIAQNGDSFDIKKINTRFVMLGMKPPTDYRTIDTLKIARRHFKFTSNKLDDLGNYLGVGRKVETGGFQLWKDCMDGVKGAIEKMVKYCKGDVLLLERVYLKLRAFMKNHPNLAVDSGKKHVCPSCTSDKVHKNGTRVTNHCRYQRWQCQACGFSFR